MAESEEQLKSLLMSMKEESEKANLKLNIQKTKIMASGPITSWQIDRETVETVTDFILGGSKNHCRWWLQAWKKLKDTCSLKKSYDKPRQHIKNRRYFANKGPSSQSYGFSSGHVWMWELDYIESWRPKNWCFWGVEERLLRVPWTARRSNQSILKEISPEYSLEGLMLKLKLQNTLATWCKELAHFKRPWCWEKLKVGV